MPQALTSIAPAIAPPSPDVLSNALAGVRSERAVTARFSLSAPWALHSTGVEGLLIRMCVGAPYWLQPDGAAPVLIDSRDIAMLPHGSAHTLSSAPGLAAQPIRDIIAAHSVGRHGDHPIVFSHGGGGPVTQMFSLHLWMPAQGLGSVIRSLPPLIVLRQAEVPTTAALALAMESLVDETVAQRPGWQLSAARMADLLLVHIVREHLVNAPRASAGWLRGLDDQHIAHAMAQMHEHPQRPWTVDSLAASCHLSRTVFTERFRALVGAAPMNYLTSFRMTLAADKLRQKNLSLYQVAEAVGYESDKAFARAFRRWTGVTPSAYVKRLRAEQGVERPTR